MICVPVTETSAVAEARRRASEIAAENGFNEGEAGRVALVVTELATNLIKHGGGGDILVGAFDDTRARGVEVIAIDKGRGIADLEACLRDGYSSAGTAGNGLGAVFRQSHTIDVVSRPGLGTGILARLEAGAAPKAKMGALSRFGVVHVAMPGQEVCGDAWAIDESDGVTTLLVADGLGHGPDAAEASNQAVRAFHRHKGHRVATLLDYIHGALRPTRGAAVSVARVDHTSHRIEFGGIGNVAGVIATAGGARHMVSMPGTAGHIVRKIQTFEYPSGGTVILASDGLSTSWALDRYPGLVGAHPTLIAAVLFRDFWRRRDDVTVLVANGHGPS